MSKYDVLWKEIQKLNQPYVTLTYDEIKEIIGFNIDHSFLSYKKELISYGYKVGKISMKNKTVEFKKTEEK